MQSTQRYVIFAFLAAAILVWATIAKLGGAIAYSAGFPDPTLVGDSFSLTAILGFVIAAAAAVFTYKNKTAHNFANEVVIELLKCTWPGKNETRTATIVVIITAVIIAVILGLFDAVWANLTGLIYRSPTQG